MSNSKDKKGMKDVTPQKSEEDIFLKYSGIAVSWCQKNMNVIAIVFLGLVAIGGAYGIYSYTQKKAAEKAQEELFVIEKDFSDLKEKFEVAEANYKAEKDKSKDAKKPENYPSGEFAKDYGSITQRFEKFILSQNGTPAASKASLTLAKLYLENEKQQEAYDILVKTKDSTEFFKSLRLLMLGTALEHKGQCAEANQEWKKILSNETARFLHAETHLRMGLCYENLAEIEQARVAYEKVQKDFADSESAKKAIGYLRQLDMKSSQQGG